MEIRNTSIRSSQDVNVSPRVFRDALYIPADPDSLFGWCHTSNGTLQYDCTAVICSPIGYEYSHSHRSLRHLADMLARTGVPAIRFDYHGIGDSPGDGLESQGLQRWKSDIAKAVNFARERFGHKRICLIGVRFGATLAALVASETSVDFLVLWSPCVNGRQFVRELKALATGGDESGHSEPAPLESGGLRFTPELIAAFQEVELRNQQILPGTKVLVIGRDDLSPDDSFPNQLNATGIENEYVMLPGFAGMMAEPQRTEVPHLAISSIAAWLVRQELQAITDNVRDHDNGPSASQAQIDLHCAASPGGASGICERICQFGNGNYLFGILTQPANAISQPVVIMFNAGCQHHAGPNRLYVSIARLLAQAGFASLRFDLEGIGDSILRGDGMENNAYPDSAAADARTAINYLSKELGFTRFVAMGLCSGAHTAFHVGVDVEDANIPEIILINPLTFHWVEGMSLETSRQNSELAHYKQSVWKSRSWLKLLTGEVNMLDLLRVAKNYLKRTIRSHYDGARELLTLHSTPLSIELKKVFRLKRNITLLIAEGDPGYDILLAGARQTTVRGIKAGRVCVKFIANADHTFSPFKSREILINYIAAYLRSRFR